MADFLLELTAEEIPARMQAGARKELEKLFRRELDAAGIACGDLVVWSTPRRLALIARGLPLETQAVREEAKGPPVGAPDQAVNGFCRKNGVTRDQLEERDVKGRTTWFAVKDVPGQAVSDLLAAAIPAIIRDFSWPKSMRWGAASISSESLKWVRPLTGIIALLDGEVVPVVLDGIASGRETVGHRFHSSGPIIISGADEYAATLRAAHVIVDHEERAGIIREAARKAARAVGLSVVEDEGLVVENAGLTEWPVPLLGRFAESFLEVPPEVIQLTARVNQKYFVCTRSPAQAGASGDGAQPHEVSASAGTRRLANAFICTSNIASADPAVVVDGNRKVLAARLADARFFWELDQKKTLAEHAKGLERVTFNKYLGTMADKVDRVAKLARRLCAEGIVRPNASPREGGDLPEGSAPAKEVPAFAGTREELADLAEQAALLCKADLVTEMVAEFPELQGLMGGYYAEKEGLPREVSDAIRDHYKPVGQGDDVPTAPVTVAVSLADKIDTFCTIFTKVSQPTGSKDPFALRRASLGILNSAIVNRLPMSVTELTLDHMNTLAKLDKEESIERDPNIKDIYIKLQANVPREDIVAEINAISDDRERNDKDYALYAFEWGNFLTRISENWRQSQFRIEAFFEDRFEQMLVDSGVRREIAYYSAHLSKPIYQCHALALALEGFIETTEGANLLAGYNRASSILKKEGYDNSRSPAKAVAQSAAGQRDALDPRLRGEAQGGRGEAGGKRGEADAIAATGEEDPLALAGKPEFDDAFRSTSHPSGKDLSYTPEPAEKALIDALDAAEPKAAAAIEAEDFESAMSALSGLRSAVDRFFEDVVVNAEEAEKRAARLELLARLRDAVHQVADFSRIEG
ncbi:MAG: glycine--tRNA ligase subunit beta [Erythrobacter sp.]